MEGAFTWLSQLIEWLGRLFPRLVILDGTEAAVKWVRGKHPKYCGPGLHWYWPIVTTFSQAATARQADRLQAQTIVTTDDKTIIVSGLIVYTIPDLLTLLTTTYHAQTAVADITLTAIHDVCCQMSWEELKGEQRRGTLDTKLKNAAQRELKNYGISVIKLMLTDLAPAKVLKLVQSMQHQDDILG